MKQAKRSERNVCWPCAGWFGTFLEERPGGIRTLNGASDRKRRFEIKLPERPKAPVDRMMTLLG